MEAEKYNDKKENESKKRKCTSAAAIAISSIIAAAASGIATFYAIENPSINSFLRRTYEDGSKVAEKVYADIENEAKSIANGIMVSTGKGQKELDSYIKSIGFSPSKGDYLTIESIKSIDDPNLFAGAKVQNALAYIYNIKGQKESVIGKEYSIYALPGQELQENATYKIEKIAVENGNEALLLKEIATGNEVVAYLGSLGQH